MSDDRRFERSAREWLEAGPDRVPARALAAAFAEIDTTPQERDPWVLRGSPTCPCLPASRWPPSSACCSSAASSPCSADRAKPCRRPRADRVGGAEPYGRPPGTRHYTTLPGWIVFEHFGQAPDGSTTQMDTDRRQIWLVHADGTGLHELAPGQPVDGKYAPDISPDGKSVVFSAWDAHVQVWEAGIEGGAPRLLTTDCSGVPDVCREEEPAYSPDGSKIVLRAWRPPVDGPRDTGPGDRRPIRARADSHRWSGREVVAADVVARRSSDRVRSIIEEDPKTGEPVDSRIFIVNGDGTGLHQMPLDEATPWGDPDWSPDGSRIVFSSWPIHDFNSDKVQVYSARPDGSDIKQLTTTVRRRGGAVMDSRWSAHRCSGVRPPSG